MKTTKHAKFLLLVSVSIFVSTVFVFGVVDTHATIESTQIADMSTVRGYHSLTKLQNGKILAVGGYSSTSASAASLATAELYDSNLNTWTPTGSMNIARGGHRATLLDDGRVLVTGGAYDGFTTWRPTTSAEIYNPATGTWASAASMLSAHYAHVAIKLNNGKVLVASGGNSFASLTTSCEIYDPASNTWSSAGTVPYRWKFGVALLPDGRAMIAGGEAYGTIYSSTHIYNPASNTWSAGPSMLVGRQDFRLIKLDDGRLLASGGANTSSGMTNSEIYDPSTNAWTAIAALPIATMYQIGGVIGQKVIVSQPENRNLISYNVSNNTWSTESQNFLYNVTWHEMATMNDGRLLFSGGMQGSTFVKTAFTVADITTNGLCGSANAQSFATAPATNLCSTGTPTTVTNSGTGSWKWSCTGSNGGTNASCSANLPDTITPTVTLTSQPMNYSNQVSGTIAFSASETATFECKMDSGAYAVCVSPYSYSGLANGQHTFTVRATDSASNVSTPVAFTWTVNTTLVASSVIMLPQTGQTTCYDAAAATITCAGTGQDGDIKAGATWPNPRFLTNGDGTVTDKMTGFIWLKDANCFGRIDWNAATSSTNALANGQCNLSDGSNSGEWRMPSIKEFQSIIDFQRAYPALPAGHPFNNFPGDLSYWSSSTYENNQTDAWNLYVATGQSGNGSKSSAFFVWPVKIKQNISSPIPRFTDNSDGTVNDNMTGLIWLKDASCFGKTNWNTGLNKASTLANGQCGLSDGSKPGQWRLPNNIELISLIDYTKSMSAQVNDNPFLNIKATKYPEDYYWSSTSTSVAGYNNGSWILSMIDGHLQGFYKTDSYYIWPVRGGLVNKAVAPPSDTSAPVITVFTIPSTSASLAVPVSTLTATDAVGVTAYCLTETNSASGCSWNGTKPTSYTFTTAGNNTLYAFAKDAAGNISDSANTNTIITLPTADTTPPTVVITAPVNGANGDVLWDINGTANDNSSVAKVEVQIYNGIRYIGLTGQFSTTAVWLTAITTNNWQTWTLDTSNFSMNTINAAYTITARATDGSGNVSIPAVVSFTRGNGTGSGTTMLLVSKSEAAAGTLISSPAGISCDTLCGATGASYTTGASVSLTATPAAGYYFLNWNNCDTPNSNICTVSVSTNHSTVTANFNAKKVTTLSLTPHTQTLTLNQNLTVSGRLATLPDLPSADLSNQTISITIKGPDGQQTLDTKTSDNNGTWSMPLSLFSKKGTYFISVSYAGAEKMMNCSSDTATILVAKSAGYAIIIHGKINSNEGLLDHLHTTDMIREKLIQRLFLDEDITYLKSSATTAPSKTDVQNAIITWAKNKLNTSPAPLVVVLVDHGDPSQFHIGNDYITPQDLAGWMTTLDSSLTPDARAENQIVVIGTCYSGSFIPALSRPGRIIITSADAIEQSIRGTMVGYADDKTTKIRQGEAFLEELFSRLGSGKYLGDAFKQAVDALTPKIPRITNGTFSNFGDKFSQHPLLDADGDGKGSYLLDGTPDGLAIAKLVTGEGAFNAGSYPADITSATATQYLQSYETSDLLWLKADQDSRIGNAWIELRKPDTTINSSGTGQVILDLETITLTHNSSAGRWETTYKGFTVPGTYEIYYYTQDSQTGDISPMVRSLVYTNKPSNNSPAAFNLTSPTNASSQKTVLVLGWQQSSDPDNDPFTYTVQISRDSTFGSIDYQLEEITDSQVAIASDAGLADNTTYYWRVIAVDQYGALKSSIENWSFTTDNTNGLPGIIKGYLKSSSGVPISGAKVAIGTVSTTTLSNGAFMTTVPTGSYTVTATATGYQQKSVMVTATAGKTVDASLSLSATDTPMPVNGACGTDNTKTLSTTPANLCTTGTATAVTGTGPWSWTCTGTNGGTTASCSANIQTYTATGSITGGNGIVTCTSPVNSGTTSTCTVTPATGYQLATFTDNSVDQKASVTGGIYSITNVTANHTISATFSLIAVNGTCGSSDKGTFTTAPTINFCSTGSPTAVTGTGPWNWTCTGTNGGATATCSASLTPAPVNGTCGSSDKWTFTTAPTTNFCTTGSPTAVTGTGPWSWTCDGANGGSTATCTASKSAPTKPGDCDNNGTVTIAEVQSAINMFLGLKTVEACVDQDSSNSVSIAEVQKVINSFLGL